MICKVEIWRDKKIIDMHTSESVWECVKWFHDEYRECYDRGECCFEVYLNGEKLVFNEKKHLGFMEDDGKDTEWVMEMKI